jgi:hypothetical protein
VPLHGPLHVQKNGFWQTFLAVATLLLYSKDLGAEAEFVKVRFSEK